eukprot:CAMPEP_0184747210 /NCGR_PEP_ID=MMETSP0315-20130426/9550_1 /TAXON_ID=101924 /ORGANISM="Rhodosorus marinus, Strain UTEX LB 2760" /LENGTH=94 /DNA_ID=CAMNT_0027219985 /DNA_START=64 /DNA_END=348 /DNA_ORIENTATION=+
MAVRACAKAVLKMILSRVQVDFSLGRPLLCDFDIVIAHNFDRMDQETEVGLVSLPARGNTHVSQQLHEHVPCGLLSSDRPRVVLENSSTPYTPR